MLTRPLIAELECQRPGCGRLWGEHANAGGPCEATGCAGFRWVPLEGPTVGSYREAPQPPR